MISLDLVNFGYVILVLNLILYSISFFRERKVNGFFMLYLCFAVIMNFFMEVLYLLHQSNLIVMNLFFIGDLILIGLFYVSILKGKKQKTVVKSCIGVALLFILMQLVFDPSQLFKFNLFEITLCSLLLVGFALVHLYNMLSQQKEYYYFTIAVILYMSSSTILYLVGNLTIDLSEDYKFISWGINAALLIIYQLFILYEWKVSFAKKTTELN
jgi:hypothetical protein